VNRYKQTTRTINGEEERDKVESEGDDEPNGQPHSSEKKILIFNKRNVGYTE
jgi:hypothetical protein